MNFLYKLPIRYQLLLIVIIMALPVVGIIVNTGVNQRNEAIHIARNDAQKLADRIADEQQNMNISARQLMVSLAQLPEVKQKDVGKVSRILSESYRANPDLTNIFIADRSGTVWATAVPTKPPFIIADRRYFKNALANDRLSSGEYVVSRVTNRPTFNLSYPIKSDQGETVGVIAIGFSLEKYTQLLERSNLPKDASFVLLDHKGVILFRGIEPEKYIGKQSGTTLFKQIQAAPDESTTVGTSMSSGDERIISSKKLRLQGESSPYMYIRVGIPVESALSSANSQLLKNLVFLSWVLLLAFLFSSFIGERFIVSRIVLLEKASQSLANGNYRIKANDRVKWGELGRLAESFDAMAEKLIGREEALASSERFLNTIIDTEPECIKLLDADGNLLMMNKAGLDMIEADSFEQVKGRCICLLVTSPYKDAFVALTRQVFEGKPGSLEFETVGLKGRHLWMETHAVPFCNEHGEIVALLGISRNITERKRAEDELLRSKQFSESVINSMPDIFYVINAEGRFIRVNDKFLKMSACSLEEVRRMHALDFIRADEKKMVEHMIDEVFEKGESSVEAYFLSKDGTMTRYYFTGLLSTIDNVPLLVGMGIDSTERNRAEEERQHLEKQLLHAQKLESLGVLAGGIAHDFNNILTAIVGNADLALMRMNPESPAIDNLHKIEHAAARAADLAKQMLAYSGKGKFVIEHINLNLILEEMMHMLKVSISKKAVLRLDLAPNLPAVEADATQMRQIVMNLVINASEAIGDQSGVISVRTGCMDCDASYLQDVWQDDEIGAGRYVFLEIVDTGCGMDKNTLAKIFDPFFTTKFTGRGLGMAAVIGIVRGHKGSIKVYSEPRKGTTFKILIPSGDKPAEIYQPVSASDDWKGSGTVLLVDDEETIRGIGKEMLREMGFTTITANDGREALELFKTTPEIAFVIMDLTMPHMDGEQCFREMRRVSPEIRIIMSSGFSEHEVTQKFLGRGLAGFIQKPYKFSALKGAIRSIMI